MLRRGTRVTEKEQRKGRSAYGLESDFRPAAGLGRTTPRGHRSGAKVSGGREAHIGGGREAHSHSSLPPHRAERVNVT